MLVLSRRVGETIVIGDDVRVTVVDFVQDRWVKLGIEAPERVPVWRRELWLEITGEEQRDAGAEDQ